MASFVSGEINQTNPTAIFTRIAHADKSAARECVDVYGNMIWAMAKQFTDSAADAEKAVPEIFADIWHNAAFCDLEISEECVWVALIARRRLSKYAIRDSSRQMAVLPLKLLAGEIGQTKRLGFLV